MTALLLPTQSAAAHYRLPHKPLPALIQLPPQLTDPAGGDPKHLRHHARRLAPRQLVGQLLIARGQRLEPVAEVDPQRRDVGRRHTARVYERGRPGLQRLSPALMLLPAALGADVVGV